MWWVWPNQGTPFNKGAKGQKQSQRGLNCSKRCSCWPWKSKLPNYDRVHVARTCEWPLGAEVTSGWQPARRQGPQFYNCKEVNNLRELELSPVESPAEDTASRHFISSLVSPWADNAAKMHQAPDPWRQGGNKFFSATKFVVICSIVIDNKSMEFVLCPWLTGVIITACSFSIYSLSSTTAQSCADGFIFLKTLKYVILGSKMVSGFAMTTVSRVPLLIWPWSPSPWWA